MLRLLYIKYPLTIQGKELQTAAVLMSICLLLTSVLEYPWKVLPIRQQRTDDICLGRSREFNLVLYDYVSPNQEPRGIQLVVLILMVITIVELAMYISICKHLYDHDISMKSMLPDATLRKRHKKNAIDLFGHILSFATDNLVPVLAYIGPQFLPASDLTKLILYALMPSTYGIYGFFQILISKALQKELLKLLDALFLLPCLYKILAFFAYVGLISPHHAQSVTNFRNNYLSSFH